MIRHKWTYRFHNLVAHPLLILWPSVGEKLHKVFDFENGPKTAVHLSCKNCGHNIYEHKFEHIDRMTNVGTYYSVGRRRLSCIVHCCRCPVYDEPMNTWDVKLSRLWWRNFQ